MIRLRLVELSCKKCKHHMRFRSCTCLCKFRYVITDYEQKNFTVAQALFNDTEHPNIVPIPWNATTLEDHSSGISRDAKIGVGVGVGLVGLLALLLLFYMVFKPRKAPNTDSAADQLPQYPPPSDTKSYSIYSTKEMGTGSVSEVHGVCQVELFDGSTPSGSGHRINELPVEQDFSPAELGTYRRTPTPSTFRMEESPRPQTTLSPRASTNHSRSAASSTAHSRKNSSQRTVFDPKRRISKRSDTSSSRCSPTLYGKPSIIDYNKALPPRPISNLDGTRRGSIPSPLSTASPGQKSNSSSRTARRPYPTVLITKEPCPSPPSTPISESDQVSPVATRHNSHMSRPQSLGASPTYAMGFDYQEAYSGGDGGSVRSGRMHEY